MAWGIMNKKEELQYLLDLTAEAAKWNVDDGDNAFELEVKDRMQKLIDALVDPDDVPARKSPSSTSEAKKSSNDKYRETHVKIRENGKEVWCYREDCEYVLNEKTGKMHWQRKQKQHPLQDADFDVENA